MNKLKPVTPGELLREEFLKPMKVLDSKTLAARIARSKASRVISIRVPERDLALAREQAAKRGLPTKPTSNRCCTKLSKSTRMVVDDGAPAARIAPCLVLLAC